MQRGYTKTFFCSWSRNLLIKKDVSNLEAYQFPFWIWFAEGSHWVVSRDLRVIISKFRLYYYANLFAQNYFSPEIVRKWFQVDYFLVDFWICAEISGMLKKNLVSPVKKNLFLPWKEAPGSTRLLVQALTSFHFNVFLKKNRRPATLMLL